MASPTIPLLELVMFGERDRWLGLLATTGLTHLRLAPFWFQFSKFAESVEYLLLLFLTEIGSLGVHREVA